MKYFYRFGALIVGFVVVIVVLFGFSKDVQYMILSRAPFIGDTLGYVWGGSSTETRYDLAFYYFSDYDSRDLLKAKEILEPTVNVEVKSEKAYYLMARILFGLSDMESTVVIADEYLVLFPNNKRMHYVRGLAYAYQQKWENAEEDFKIFIAHDPKEWAGYLDLSWIYFQNGKMTSAREIIETGYALFPDNAWLNTAFGVVLHNQEEIEQAEFLLTSALTQAKQITIPQWRAAYSASDPKNAQSELNDFVRMIEYNLALVQSDGSIGDAFDMKQILGIRFANFSLRGADYGLHPSACNATCPACNICGVCNGVVGGHASSPHSGASCAAPGLPVGYGEQCVSANNVCQQNNPGTVGCSGCTASIPEVPVPNVDGYVYVANAEQIFVYEAGNFTESTAAQNCYSYVNNSGLGTFVPLKTENEFEAFVGADVFNTNSLLELDQLNP